MARNEDREMYKMSMLAEVASLYYEKDMTQAEIAQKLCITRTRISRLLQEARQRGIVEIRINYNLERHYELERRTKEHFGLKEVYLLNARGRTPEQLQQGVTSLGVAALRKHIKTNAIIGLTWGETVSKIVNTIQLSNHVPLDIVQLMGAISYSSSLSSPQEVISKFAEATGGRPHFLNMPFIVRDDEAKRVLMCDANNSKTLRSSVFCDAILTSIGVFDAYSQCESWLGYMDRTYSDELKQIGAVGCICGRFFDAGGKELDCAWNRQCVGITLDQLRKIDNVICVSNNIAKLPALYAAAKSKIFNVLVTDGTTAQHMLNLSTKGHI